MLSDQVTKKLNLLSRFIHESQKERYFISAYLSSDSAYDADLSKQFIVVDEVMKDLLDIFFDDQDDIRIKDFLDSLPEINNNRQNILGRSIDLFEVTLFYNREIIAPTIDIISELMIFNFEKNSAKIGAYINLVQLKERIGLERASGAILIVKRDFTDKKLLLNIRHLIAKQEAYEKIAFSSMDEEQKLIFSQRNVVEVINKVKAINKIITDKNLDRVEKELSKISLVQWLKIFNAKIDLLYEIEGKFIVDISQNYGDKKKEEEVKNNSNASKIAQYLEIIRHLPIFVNVQEEDLQDILKYSHINDCKKGSLLFSEGEMANRFYIVLEGWIKIFRGNSEGEESIMQMVGIGSPALGTTIVSNSSFPASAQIISKAKVLSIPAVIIREYIRKNNDLANNMLATIANQSKDLISQLGQLTLQTAQQRVGWFLLDLFLKEGEKGNNVSLPYDKSLIASYLGMKPETFSRMLQTMKDENELEVDKNVITLSDAFSLCHYCDNETASKCNYQDSNECPEK